MGRASIVLRCPNTWYVTASHLPMTKNVLKLTAMAITHVRNAVKTTAGVYSNSNGVPPVNALSRGTATDDGRRSVRSDDVGAELKGVRSGVVRRRDVCVGIVSEGPWAERDAAGK
jgi:hypothetical protein|eukprot:30466-Pelagococcus_subviridis.AAC.1